MKITIEITQEDIDRGIRCSNIECPVAYALTRALNKKVRVNLRSYYLMDNWTVLLLPKEASNFIKTFDQGITTDVVYEQPKPFSFEIEVPE